MTNALKTFGVRLALVLMLALAVVAVAACGGDDADAGDAVAAGDDAQHDDDGHDDDDGDHADGADDGHEDDGDHADDADDGHGDDGDHGDEEGGALAAEADLVIDMEMKDFEYLPAQLKVQAGDVVHFNVENTAFNIHDFTIDKIDADMHIVALPGTGEHAHMDGPMADLHFAFTEPGRGAIQVRIHEPGEYVFYCTVPGHRELGMEGTLVVEAADTVAEHGDHD